MQITLFAFNLLPCYPLDGGQILASVLLSRGYDANKAAKITSIVAAPFALGLLAFGITQWAMGKTRKL
jgi:Zn-dependent protease